MIALHFEEVKLNFYIKELHLNASMSVDDALSSRLVVFKKRQEG